MHYWIDVCFGIYNLTESEISFISDNKAPLVEQFVHSVSSGFATDSILSGDDFEIDYFLRNCTAGNHLKCEKNDKCNVLQPFEMVQYWSDDLIDICPSCTINDSIRVGFIIKSSYWVCDYILHDIMSVESHDFSHLDVLDNRTAVEQYVDSDMREYLETVTGPSAIQIAFSGASAQITSSDDLSAPSPTDGLYQRPLFPLYFAVGAILSAIQRHL